MPDVVTGGGGYSWGYSPSGPPRRGQPRRAARVTGQRIAQAVARAAPALARASWIVAGGVALWQFETALIRRLEEAQFKRMEAILTAQDKLAMEAWRRARAKWDKETKRLQAEEAAFKARGGVIYDPNAAPIYGNVLPPKDKPFIAPPSRVLYKPGAAPGGTGSPGSIPTVPGVPVPAPPVSTAKSVTKKVYDWAQTPLGMTLIGTSLALFAAKTSKSAPYDAPYMVDEPLTGFQPEPVAYGELGGVPALDPGFEEEEVDEGCENVQPKRKPGECRQGWFEESPSELRLREWSRRPCQ